MPEHTDNSPLEVRLMELLTAVREDEDPAARRELNDLLRSDPAARGHIATLLVDEHALIRRLREEGIIAILDAKPRPVYQHRLAPARSARKPSTHWKPLVAAAAVLIAGFFGWLALRPSSGPKGIRQVAAIAVLKEEVDAVWRKSPHTSGSALTPGMLSLESGMAAIVFTSGARILLEGPAELQLISNMEASCRSGKLRAHVPPPAQGFTILTPSSRVVDRGTIFGLSVRNDGSALVKVMQGEVELQHQKSVYQIKTNAAALIDPAGNPTPTRIPDDAFPSEENFSARIVAVGRSTAARWQSAAAALARDPSTLLAYSFEESTNTSRTVRNHTSDAPLESHGTLVGTGWNQGRWMGKRALEFNGRGDRLLFELDATSPAATFIAWIRIDSLSNPYQILLMPNHYRKSALQWLISQSGELRLALSNGKGDPSHPGSWEGPVKAHAISNLDFGRWVFLASSYNSATGEVVHYRDGQPIGSGSFPAKIPVVFGSFSFGNWATLTSDSNDHAKPREYRNFDGRLDELAILSRALSSSEISRIYQNGKP